MTIVRLEGIKRIFQRDLTPHQPTVGFHLDRFEVQEGEKVALVGSSGCGKSTLLHLVGGMIRPDAGTVEVEGKRLDQMPGPALDRFRGRTIGYVFQDHNLVPALSALDNVLLGLRFGGTVPRMQWNARAKEMLDRVGLGHRRRYRPDRLSVGERQRVAIARALANHPPILLADEPTGSLDPANSAQVFSLLREMCDEGTHTLLLVTHDAKIAARLDRRFDCERLIHESDGAQ